MGELAHTSGRRIDTAGERWGVLTINHWPPREYLSSSDKRHVSLPALDDEPEECQAHVAVDVMKALRSAGASVEMVTEYELLWRASQRCLPVEGREFTMLVNLGPPRPLVDALAEFLDIESVTLWNDSRARAAGVQRVTELDRLAKAGVPVAPTREFHFARGWTDVVPLPEDGTVVVQRLVDGEPVGTGIPMPASAARSDASVMALAKGAVSVQDALAKGAVSVQDSDMWDAEVCVPVMRGRGCAPVMPPVANRNDGRGWFVDVERQTAAMRLAERIVRLVWPLPVRRIHLRARDDLLEVHDLSTVAEVFATGPTVTSLAALGVDRDEVIQLSVLGPRERIEIPEGTVTAES